MTMENMTKEELKVWRMVKARWAEDQAQFNVIDEQDEAFMNAAAVAAAIADSQRRICELIDSKAGTSAITYSIEVQTKTRASDKIECENPLIPIASALPST